MTTLFSASSAHAGSWVFTYTGSGNSTINFANGTSSSTTWTPPPVQNGNSSLGNAVQTGSFSLGGNVSASSYFASSVTATVTVTVTATWTHAAGQTNATDPAPPKVWLCENSSAQWSGWQAGSASDGLGADYHFYPNGNINSGTAASGLAPATVPPAYWKSWTVTGGVVTLPTRTLKAEADYTGSPLGGYCNATIGGYSVTVHPQPYNYRQDGDGIDNGDGTISWNYKWDSTNGSLADIGTGCTIYEYVSYNGNTTGTIILPPNGGYIPPVPPIAKSPADGKIHGYINPTIWPNPTVPGGWAEAGGMSDIQDKPPTFAPSSSLVGATWIATQTYKFDDTATGEKQVTVPGPGAGPTVITRTVYFVGTPPHIPTWYYTVNKSGLTSAPLLLP